MEILSKMNKDMEIIAINKRQDLRIQRIKNYYYVDTRCENKKRKVYWRSLFHTKRKDEALEFFKARS